MKKILIIPKTTFNLFLLVEYLATRTKVLPVHYSYDESTDCIEICLAVRHEVTLNNIKNYINNNHESGAGVCHIVSIEKGGLRIREK